MKKKLLELIHNGHCGRKKSIRLTRDRFYWPGLIEDITASVNECKPCLALKPSQPREKLITEKGTEPISNIGSDVFEFRKIIKKPLFSYSFLNFLHFGLNLSAKEHQI